MNKNFAVLLSCLTLIFLLPNYGFTNNNPKGGIKEKYSINGVTFTMVYCPSGNYVMGSPPDEQDRMDDETQHSVTLTKGFWMLETEVTQEIYQAIMGSNPSYFKGNRLPVERVSWFDAVTFCNKLSIAAKLTPYYNIKGRIVSINSNNNSFRLPTEAEWEYAARAGETTTFHYGNKLDSTMANFNGDYPYGGAPIRVYRKKTINVKSFKPNAWGLYDMHGNVMELCWDFIGIYSGDAVDPLGDQNKSFRIRRGGGWRDHSSWCRSASRRIHAQANRWYDTGFRFVRTY